MKHTIKLIVGDWSGDGHEFTEDIIIKTNLDKRALRAAYEEGSKELGFDFQKEVCEEYEDNTISDKYVWILEGHGIKVFPDGDFEEASALDVESYVRIWLGIAKLGNKTLEYEIMNIPYVAVGGYGLWSL